VNAFRGRDCFVAALIATTPDIIRLNGYVTAQPFIYLVI